MQANVPSQYPVTFDVDYPEQQLDRVSTAFRVIIAIPILILLAFMTQAFKSSDEGNWFLAAGGVMLFVPTLLMIVVRQKYPRWWFDFNLELVRFQNRVAVFMALMRDEYPSTDEQQSVHLEVPYPNVQQDLSRWLPLVKWFLAFPHFIMLFLLFIAGTFVVIFAWFAILFTGTYPRGAFEFIEGILRWSNRVTAYAFLLATDEYPPFRLGA